MIHVIVGTRHLQEILGYGLFNPALYKVIYPALDEITGKPFKEDEPIKLAEWTVFDVLEDFHERASALLRANAKEIIESQRQEILRVARDEYHHTAFECTPEDACESFAVHRVSPHGSLSHSGKSAYLPDFSIGARCVAIIAYACPSDREKMKHEIAGEFYARSNAFKCDFSDLECHLCDTLYDVYQCAVERWEKLREERTE